MRIKFYFLIIILLISSSANAITVRTTFRADSRPPDAVFRDGFRAFGVNINYYSHILGISLIERNSAFISTTSNIDVASRFARERADLNNNIYYIYNIRATDNFYPALETIDLIYENNHQRIGEDIRLTVAREQEYSAYNQISPQQIRSVTTVQYINSAWHEVTTANPNYVDGDTHSHDGPWTTNNPTPLNPRPRLLTNTQGIGVNFLPQPEVEQRRLPFWCLFCLHSEL